MFIHGDHNIINFSNNTIVGPSIGPDDWRTQGLWSPTGLTMYSNAAFRPHLGRHGPNYFEDLYYGIYTVGSTFILQNSSFTNIGNNESNDLVILPNSEVASRTAIRCRFPPGVSLVNNCDLINCGRGMAFEGSMATVWNNRIDVFTGGVNSISTPHLEAYDNRVSAKQFALRAINVGWPVVRGNVVTLSNSDLVDESAGIQFADLIGGDIINNYVTTVNSRAGILLDNVTRTWVTDNTVRVLSPNESSGIVDEGGLGHLMRCNDISSNSDNTGSPSHGFLAELSGGSNFFSNSLRDLTYGINIGQASSIYDIQYTQFKGGHIGLNIESFLGEQEHRINEWKTGLYTIDAISSLPPEVNQEMQFIVAEPECFDANYNGYNLFPCTIDADGQWFEYVSGGEAEFPSENCSNGVGTDIALWQPEEELEILCEWNETKADTLTCDINKSTQIKLITNNLKSGIYMVSYRGKTGNIQTAKLMIVK